MNISFDLCILFAESNYSQDRYASCFQNLAYNKTLEYVIVLFCISKSALLFLTLSQ